MANYHRANEINGEVNISIGDYAPPSQSSREWSIKISPEQAEVFALEILTASIKAKQSQNYKFPSTEISPNVEGIEAYHCLDCDKLISKNSIGLHSSDHTTRKVIIKGIE